MTSASQDNSASAAESATDDRMSDYRMINATGELVAFCDRAAAKGYVIVDTEFVRTRTYYAQLGLVQASCAGEAVLIDPLNGVDLQPLWQLLSSGVEVILHAGGEDLELFHRYDALPKKLFDSQVAHAFLTDGSQIGYAGLVEKMLGIAVDKSQSRTDWLQRPLSKAQLDYAAADVIYLERLQVELKEQVEQLPFADLVWQECREQVQKRARDVAPQVAWRDIGGVSLLPGTGRAILRELAAWRLQTARTNDVALPFILRDPVMVEIARTRPQNRHQLGQIADIHPRSLRLYGDAVLSCVAAGEAVPASEQPEDIPRYDQLPGYKRFFKAAKALFADVAEETGIPVSLLGSRKQINDVFVYAHFTSEASKSLIAKPDLCSGWRADLLVDGLQALLAESKR
ncbi:ribonuclease D [Aliidiomarina haloalkalitolerans]|uniref:Ribonuclease D n=1 Tax=Aliidiomarina haloalkalitolerans TaxID=859059 RepID=A0A432VXF2_9GAMM|nr:ribonuclease D [Aliidiomarina haloalkalitolerans]MCL4409974.1 ribonuclease D [Gammaproteobacteria bacterium]RUO21349.1 ribonuclease D [Aliidiomarina haloalkalitolerans]